MQVTTSWADAWWILVFVAALVGVAQVPPRRPAEVKEEHDPQPEHESPGGHVQ